MRDKLLKAFAANNIECSERKLAQCVSFWNELIETNKSLNLTAITDEAEAVDKHFLDSLAMGRVKIEGKMLDVGSGAGFPGIPLHIFFPEADITLLDSLQKRLTFIENTCIKADIPLPTLLHARAEEAGRNKTYREQYDIVVSRAVANLTTLAEYCLPFVKTGGTFIAYKGPGAAEELQNAAGALAKLGGKCDKVDAFTLPNGEERSLIYILKEHPTAPTYPRNAKAIKNKPL